MPLINPVDPKFQQMQVQNRFESLPQADRENVIKVIEMGRAGKEPDVDDMGEAGIAFMQSDQFKTFYERPIEAPQPPETMMMPMLISGLLDIIRQRQQPETKSGPDLGAKNNDSETKICEHCGK